MENKNVYFTCIGKGHGAPAAPATREDWESLRRESWLKDMCARIEKGDEELKHRLPVWTPHCAEFKDNHRAIADAVKPLSRLMMDFDEKGHTDDIMKQLESRSEALQAAGIEVLLVEESVRRGTHVLLALPSGMTPQQAQELMAELTGFTPDAAVKDVARCIYMVTEEHTRYVSEKLFEAAETADVATVETREAAEFQPSKRYPQDFKGIAYADIISEYWHRYGGEPTEGERNKRLHELAVNLRSICDNSEEWLMEVMPRYGISEQEMRGIVRSACKEPTKGSRKIDEILASEEAGTDETEEDAQSCTLSLRMKNSLPKGLKESLTGIPKSMYMPTLCGIMPLAAAYADGVKVEYCDRNTHRLGLMTIIRGEQASNKSVVKNVVDIWKRQFEEEDALARKREDEWKERRKARKANEKAPDDPKVLIRLVPVTVSCSTLLKRLKNANGHTLYSFGEELDTLRKTNGAGSWSSKYDVYRLGFDNGEWGQDYNSDQAESGVVNVAYNWTMLGTNGALKRCFRSDNIENGLSSRVLIAEMPDGSFAKMSKFGKRSAEDEANIQEAVTLLRSYSGFVDTPRLRKAIEQWVEEKRVEVAKDIDHVKDTYRKRAAVIGFRCGVIFHLLSEKERESKHCIEFALLMAEYCLRQQIKAFGDAFESQYVNAREECQRYGANGSVFDQLAPTFTIGDLRALKRGFCGESALRQIISRWCRDKWIEKIDKTHWAKLLLCDM